MINRKEGYALSFSDIEPKLCVISTVTGTIIAQCLTAEIIRDLKKNIHPIPVYISSNVDFADEHNNSLQEKYKGRISNSY
ncbi:hypothetical protein [Bacillus salipaludis]|uniref:Uncharacterized protein n=1 Tax=Bacillus salipaludis TaxID=2547811 RepID=A0ABW8RMM6_9BACI